MDLHGGSLSTVSTGAQAIPGHSTRDDGECYFLGRFWTNFVGLGHCKFWYCIDGFSDRWFYIYIYIYIYIHIYVAII